MSNWIFAVIFSFYPDPIPLESLHPSPTKEQYDLIEKLGDDNFSIREKAEENLEKMDLKAYRALYEIMTKTENPEIRYRCSRVLSNIISYKTNKPIPSLFSLYNFQIKFKSGKEITGTKELFQKFFLKCSNDPRNHRLYPYQIVEIATHDLYKYLRMVGFTKQEIQQLIDAMHENMKRLYKTHDYKFYDWLK